MHYRRPKPDPFEVMLYAQKIIFVRVNEVEYVTISALAHSMSITRWCKGDSEFTSINYTEFSAQQLGLFDGTAWNLAALVLWLKQHCGVCWKPLTSARAIYCSGKCKQKAWRDRNK